MPSSFNSRQKALTLWLDANVQSYPTPKVLALKDFEIDPNRFKGDFKVVLDGQPVSGRFSFSVEGNGLPQVFLPMFHSPLGVPASFSAVSLTGETETAIAAGLKHFIPRLRPFGINKNTGELVTQSTPLEQRVLDSDALATFQRIIDSGGFQVHVEIEQSKIQIQTFDSKFE